MTPPRPHLKTARTALKNLRSIDTRTFSTESTRCGHHYSDARDPLDKYGRPLW
jgi:hypothetical protein